MNYSNGHGLKNIFASALKEDTGSGDMTCEAFIPKNKFVKAAILAKEDCVVCGLSVASAVFKEQDKGIKFKFLVKDGSFVKKGSNLAVVSGRAGSILTAERVALNFLSLLCGVSTQTKRFVNAVKPFRAKIVDTRKTIPGLRLLEKYAVRVGGGFNHRMGLDEMIMIKDNHLKVLGREFWVSGNKAIKGNCSRFRIEIEVKTLKEFNKALKLKPDIIMLDNMTVKDIKKAVNIRNASHVSRFTSHVKLEASGGITLKNVKDVASTGVDMISIGALTHSVSSVDISLEII